ncbi:MAG: A24 family peptidase, partial [Thermoproteota archaeon]|nr:A24 family peptidase [Thermoproteota archaeon]
MKIVLDGVRVALSLAFLFYASWSDFKTREVTNLVWMIFAPVGFVLTFMHFVLFNSSNLLLLWGVPFLFTFALSVALFYGGAFGGADAKALICLSIVLPVYPENLLKAWSDLPLIFPVTVFTNAVLLAAFTTLYILLHNLLWKLRTRRKLFEGFENESFGRKALTLVSGYKVSAVELEKKEYLYPMEDVEKGEVDDFRRRLVVVPKDEERDGIVKRVLGA